MTTESVLYKLLIGKSLGHQPRVKKKTITRSSTKGEENNAFGHQPRMQERQTTRKSIKSGERQAPGHQPRVKKKNAFGHQPRMHERQATRKTPKSGERRSPGHQPRVKKKEQWETEHDQKTTALPQASDASAGGGRKSYTQFEVTRPRELSDDSDVWIIHFDMLTLPDAVESWKYCLRAMDARSGLSDQSLAEIIVIETELFLGNKSSMSLGLDEIFA
ncbi:unnamed protein product [Ceutorhynchus assimilis]|uniref:Uncharacterized protein n=1 Tax=Ceutorhynchus assimilis TaxID=467358 RepID=A0A9N9MWQ0_9CUCU|nr:unnamed protein product [Ceutorhynchus assimilis]